MTPDEPYLGVQGLLESGEGVCTPPPDLRFRNLLKKHHLTVFIPVSIRHFGRGPYLSPIWS